MIFDLLFSEANSLLKRSYDRLYSLPMPPPPISPGRRMMTIPFKPSAADNPYNAWTVRFELRGPLDNFGPLADRRVGIKVQCNI